MAGSPLPGKATQQRRALSIHGEGSEEGHGSLNTGAGGGRWVG